MCLGGGGGKEFVGVCRSASLKCSKLLRFVVKEMEQWDVVWLLPGVDCIMESNAFEHTNHLLCLEPTRGRNGCKLMCLQWRSQVIADARAQHTMFARNSAQSAEARRSGTCSVSVRGERMRLEFCVIYIAILRRSISKSFSGRFAIDYDTISADNSYAYLHRWGTASSC